MTPAQVDPLTPAVADVIAAQFPNEEWAEVREAVTQAACRRVSPMLIGFDSALFRKIKARLKAVEAAMSAAGMFSFPRFYLLREVEQFRRDQDRLARSCRAAGLGDDSHAAPELPREITVRALGERAYPSLKFQVHAAMRRHGWRLDGRGCWIEPRKLLASEKGGCGLTRRIQVPDVEAALELSGAKLERCVTLERQGDGLIHCCPIGALAHVECGLEPQEESDHGVNLDVAGDALRLDPRYREAFATAFDAWPRRVFDEEIISRKPAYEQLGYADGFAVADAMMPRTEAVNLDADHPLDDGGEDE